MALLLNLKGVMYFRIISTQVALRDFKLNGNAMDDNMEEVQTQSDAQLPITQSIER